MDLCILIPLLVGLICALLGYLLGRSSSGDTKEISSDIELWKNKNAQLENDLRACRSQLTKADTKATTKASTTSSFAATTSTAAASIVFNAAAAKTVFGKKVKQDDLTLVEGIGPKISQLFHNHNVTAWKGLSETSVARCQEILDTGGERYTVHNPGTWPRQAKMAYEGKWKELKDWQDILDKGKE
ncbi:hypothetical protein [Ulvibacter antarcticus]|uniref:Uncharacterized protein n=1 Tax=Ulvibacter antarcticus TaxID=442714 RepID=A0A3L9ZHE3_9FLAO|nr:hypothetical protein [Ulvibacter antarcticus]RMA66122.1 hypothetical protein BXY75_0541 [Ulvibacter antarcticus]